MTGWLWGLLIKCAGLEAGQASAQGLGCWLLLLRTCGTLANREVRAGSEPALPTAAQGSHPCPEDSQPRVEGPGAPGHRHCTQGLPLRWARDG